MSYLDTSIYYVYQLRLEGSDLPFYIGKGKGRRAKEHFFGSSLRKNNIKNNIIKKSILSDVKILCEKLHENLIEQEALDLEMYYISKYGRLDLGTGILANHTDGGEGVSGHIISQELRTKRSINSQKMHDNRSQEEKIKIIEKMCASKNARSEEEKIKSRQKFSAARSKMHLEMTPEKRLSMRKKMSEKQSISWNHAKCTIELQMKVWRRADHLYSLYLQGYDTKTKLSKKLGDVTSDNVIRIINRFKNGWNPNLDENWLQWIRIVPKEE